MRRAVFFSVACDNLCRPHPVALWPLGCAGLGRAPSEGSASSDRSVAHSPPNSLCSPEQSNDDLVMEILSDMRKRLPKSVEKEECSGTPSTLKCIISSPIWESLYKNIQGEQRTWGEGTGPQDTGQPGLREAARCGAAATGPVKLSASNFHPGRKVHLGTRCPAAVSAGSTIAESGPQSVREGCCHTWNPCLLILPELENASERKKNKNNERRLFSAHKYYMKFQFECLQINLHRAAVLTDFCAWAPAFTRPKLA